MKYKISTEDMLILRDGRPFGDDGVFGGSSVLWPYPHTIAGMVRTISGFKKNENFFDKNSKNFQENLDKILKTGIKKILPSEFINNKWQPLFPLPADLVFTQNLKNEKLKVHTLIYKKIDDNSGTDIKNRQWLIPSVDISDKPVKESPFFLHSDFFMKYLSLKLLDEYSFYDAGINPPVKSFRVHNAIDSETYITEEKKLFSNSGFYFKSINKDKITDLSIDFEALGTEMSDLSGEAYLGGERRRVNLEKTGEYFPEMPDIFKNQKYLKLILLTHGDFGDWCPDWLMPDFSSDSLNFVKIPGTEFEVRLCSACVNGFEGISGWNYVENKPKPMKKLVKPGTVYLLELKDLSLSCEIAKYFWGNSLNLSTNIETNGFGLCIAGIAETENTN
jgi:CRISPR-associated protein Cmr3